MQKCFFELFAGTDPHCSTLPLSCPHLCLPWLASVLIALLTTLMSTCLTAMTEILRAHLLKRIGHETQQLGIVLQQFKPVICKRQDQLLRQGEVCRHVYFVAEGCLQVYVTDGEGHENTRDIVIEQQWCSELISFGQQIPAEENIRAVEPSRLLAIDRAAFMRMMEIVPPFAQAYKQILEASYANSVHRLNAFVSMDALDRVKWLMQYRPTLMTRLPGKLIASYLGISQETLSRLKNRL